MKINENVKVVYCIKLKGFIKEVEVKRSILDSRLIFGIDGGGRFLKFSLSVTNELNFFEEKCSAKRIKYDAIVKDKEFKYTGVKGIFIIAITNNCQENYNNLSACWNLLNLNDFYGVFSVDLKVANIIAGLQGHDSGSPCTWCNTKKKSIRKM